jgi:nucleoside-triphosphatase
MMRDYPIILITGQPGIGKTTLIKRLAEKAGEQAGGFYTQEIREGGIRKGFEIVTFDGERTYLSLKSPQRAFDREIVFKSYRINLDGIEKVAVPALLKARAEGKIVIVDEIGPMEIFSRIFCDTIRQLLDDENVTMIGTIIKRPYQFADEVKRHLRIQIVEITYKNRDGMAAEIWGEL